MNHIDAGPATLIFGTHQPNTLEQFRDVASRAERAVLCADGHLGHIMPVGGVAAYRNQVSVTGVGPDIACGNAAILTNALLSDYTPTDLERLANDIARTISFGVGRSNGADDAPTDDPLFDSPAWSLLPAAQNVTDLKDKARAQLGTVGSGNHYVDVFADEYDRIWVGVHFGSRGFGFTVATGFEALGQGLKWGAKAPNREVLFDLTDPMGAAYYGLMELAGEYAYAGREWVARRVVKLLGASEVDLVHNHHNFAWKEVHDGQEYVVVRKGATPAWPGQRGFVGGSMGDNAVILEGVAGPLSDAALHSTVHGAGRVMSRTQARGKTKGWGKKARIVAPGLVSPEMMQNWLAEKGVILRGGGLDESPHAYRRLPEVLEAQGPTIRVLHTLRPIIVVMAGADEVDPWKD